MTQTTLLRRADAPLESTWNREAVYPSWVAWDADYDRARAELPALRALAGRLGEGPTVLLDGLQSLADSGNALVAEVVLPLVEGVAAFGHSDYTTAVQQLAPIADQIVRIGGSHAQREVFEDTLIVAQLRAGQSEQAAARLRRRLEHRHSARDASWLAQTQSKI